MRRLLLLLAFSTPILVHAQSLRTVQALLPANGIGRNGISNLHAEGNTLWVGPLLNVTRDGGQTWFVADIDSVRLGRSRLYSIDVEGDVVWAGLGYSVPFDNNNVIGAAGGFALSTDGGETFTLRRPPLDEPRDTSVVYGISIIPAEPVVDRAASPPYDVDYSPATGTIWTAGWFSGIRRSDDNGRTWQRVVLPPDDLDEITPATLYNFRLAPKRNPASQTGNYNHLGFAVLVDEDSVVWAGTSKGVNVSRDGGVSWRRFGFTGGPGGLTGPWVPSIEEQPLPGRNAVWMATWAASEVDAGGRFGVTVTRDGGATFEQVLVGERVYDFAFSGTTVYAAGQSGLLISEDDGRSWRIVRDFFDPARPTETVRPDLSALSVAVTAEGALWVGTDDGLFKSTDGGATFTRFRAEAPLRPDALYPDVPEVKSYAYPNPFSPEADRFLRFVHEAGEDARIRIFDFGMNLVRTLDEPVWDGRDAGGYRVANGTYFYAIDAGGSPLRGTILVLE